MVQTKSNDRYAHENEQRFAIIHTYSVDSRLNICGLQDLPIASRSNYITAVDSLEWVTWCIGYDLSHMPASVGAVVLRLTTATFKVPSEELGDRLYNIYLASMTETKRRPIGSRSELDIWMKDNNTVAWRIHDAPSNGLLVRTVLDIWLFFHCRNIRDDLWRLFFLPQRGYVMNFLCDVL